MEAVTIGPFIFAADRFAAILGIGAFLLAASMLAARKVERLGSWASSAVLVGVVAARLGHVVEHLDGFTGEPLRAFAVWQGGFSFVWAAPAVVALTLLRLRGAEARAWAALPVAVGLLVWNITRDLAEATGGAGGGKPLPELTLEQLEGAPIDLAATGGRPRVINLWASWCPPCRSEMPVLAEAARSTPGVDFLFVNQGETRDRVAGYLTVERLPLRHVLLDATGGVARHFGAPGIPVTLFFDGDGRLSRQHVGQVSREDLADHLAALPHRAASR